jgi:HSP20 family protein
MNKRSAAVDVVELDDAYIVRANVPGFTKDEIEITADFESLSFTAKKEIVENEEKPKYLHRERHTGDISRTMTFAKPIDAVKATVSLKDGVIEITLPISETAKAVKLTPTEN